MGDKSKCGYKFNNRYRGQAIIIVNECFPNPEEPNNPEIRKGAKSDLIKMELLFRYLGFYVTSYMDLKGSEIIEKTKLAVNDKEKNKDSDCFVFVISTHGSEEPGDTKAKQEYASGAEVWRHAVIGTDEAPVYVDEDIMSIFVDTDDDRTGLKGKPKLFFLQACRSRPSSSIISDHVDYGNEISSIPEPPALKTEGLKPEKYTFVDDELYSGWERDNDAIKWDVGLELKENDGKDSADTGGNYTVDSQKNSGHTLDNSSQSGDTADTRHSSDTGENTTQLPFEVVTINCPRDCLVMYPVQSRKYALRNIRFGIGSWMLHFLHQHKQTLLDNGLLHGLTMVMGDMAAYNSGFTYAIQESMTEAQKSELKEHNSKLPVKMASMLIHKLVGDVHFTAKHIK